MLSAGSPVMEAAGQLAAAATGPSVAPRPLTADQLAARARVPVSRSDRRDAVDKGKAATLATVDGPAVTGRRTSPTRTRARSPGRCSSSSASRPTSSPAWTRSGRARAAGGSTPTTRAPRRTASRRPARLEDVLGRRRLGDQPRHPDPLGPGLHPRPLRQSLRRVELQAGPRLVLREARRRHPVGRASSAGPNGRFPLFAHAWQDDRQASLPSARGRLLSRSGRHRAESMSKSTRCLSALVAVLGTMALTVGPRRRSRPGEAARAPRSGDRTDDDADHNPADNYTVSATWVAATSADELPGRAQQRLHRCRARQQQRSPSPAGAPRSTSPA